jgi:5-methylcytosine-specific restriction endonuclease McrA
MAARTPEQKLAQKLKGQTEEQKEAARARARAWTAANRERKRATQAAYRLANLDSIAAKKKGDYEKNKPVILGKMRQEYAADPALRERKKVQATAWATANPQKANAKSAAYRAANPAKHKEFVRRWAAANPDAILLKDHKRRARKKISGGQLSRDIIATLLSRQDNKCVYCKADISVERHLDHIMPLALGGIHADENTQLLCPRCNRRKGALHPEVFLALFVKGAAEKPEHEEPE